MFLVNVLCNLFAAMAVCGCGNSLQEAQVKKPDSIQQKEQKNKTSELFGSDSEVILANSIEVIEEYAFYKGECVKVKLGSGLQRVKKYARTFGKAWDALHPNQ